jgi:hypothetical protein
MTALMIEGTVLIPTLLAAIANGDAPASPEFYISPLSLEGTIRPIIKM